MAIVREDYFVCTDIDRNNNKFWHIQEHNDFSVSARWGRVGASEDTTSWTYSSQADAAREYDKKVKSKLKPSKTRDSYTKVEILTSTKTTTTTVASSKLADVAARDIDVDSDTTRKLIRWLSEVNVHNILNSTTMTYNKAEGVFCTPLGVVGKSMIDRARILLDDISPFVETKKYDDAALKKLVNEYLRIIPQDLGGTQRKIKIADVFTDTGFKKQADILDSLEASVATYLTIPQTGSKLPKEEQQERVFNVKLHHCDDQDQRKAVEKLFNHTRKTSHHSYGYEFKTLYTLEVSAMREAWEKDGAKLHNRMRLWHGTSVANLISILKQGLIIPKKYTNSWAYGAGIYFSDQSTKSLNYASGFWTGKAEGKRIFMFLADVGMGNYYVPPHTIKAIPKGYDSCFAEAGKSGVANHEMIVYRPSQCNLVYLVEFAQ